MKPIVDGLERDWETGRIVRLEFTEPAVRAFGERVGFEITPTFILYDGTGREVRRWVGSPPGLDELERATDAIRAKTWVAQPLVP